MTTLLTGGRGKTAIRLARLLHQANHPTLLTSRSGTVPEPFRGVLFDWLDATTYENPFQAAIDAHEHIVSVYLVAPPILDMLPSMKAFIDLAILRGVKRFVLLSAALIEKGGPAMGSVHEYLATLGVDYCVLRPSWFMENFREYHHRVTIKDEDVIYSAAEDGLIPWIAAEDIAHAAFRALVDEKVQNREPIIGGPELLSYDQIAAMLTDILGRPITHKRISEADLKQLYLKLGLSEDYAAMMSGADIAIAAGAEEAAYGAVDKVVGRQGFRDFFQVHRETWMKDSGPVTSK